MSGKDWNEESVGQLKSLFEQGLSASQMGAQLGITRNAVIGKLHRLGLKRGNGSTGRKWSWKTPKVRVPRAPRIVYKKPKSEPEIVLSQPVGFEVYLLQLEPEMCRFPTSLGEGGHLFCGAPAAEGRTTYCAFHRRLSYRYKLST